MDRIKRRFLVIGRHSIIVVNETDTPSLNHKMVISEEVAMQMVNMGCINDFFYEIGFEQIDAVWQYMNLMNAITEPKFLTAMNNPKPLLLN